jgi:hypothetical protein
MGYGSAGGGGKDSRIKKSTTITYEAAVAPEDAVANNYSLNLDGTDDYFTASSNASINNPSGTIAFWWNFPDVGERYSGPGGNPFGGHYSLVMKQNDASAYPSWWEFYYYGYSNEVRFYYQQDNNAGAWQHTVTSSGVPWNTYPVLPDWGWNHFAFTYAVGTGERGRIYKNGVLMASHNLSNAAYGQIDQTDSSGSLLFGKHSFAAGYDNLIPFNIDEFAMWDVVLTQAEIQSLVSGNICTAVSSSNIGVYYNFESGSGITITDRSSNSNHSTASGAPAWTGSVPFIGAHTPTNIPNPTDLEDGMRQTYILINGNDKGSVTWGDKHKFPLGIDPVLTGTGSAVDVVECVSDGTNLYCKLDMEDCK